MQKWIGRGVVMIAVLAMLLGVAYSILFHNSDQDFEKARTGLEKAKAELRARTDNRIPANVSPNAVGHTEASPQPETPQQVDKAAFISVITRYLTVNGPPIYPTLFPDSDRPRSEWTETQWKEAEDLLKKNESLLNDLRAFVREAANKAPMDVASLSIRELLEIKRAYRVADLLALSVQVSSHQGDTQAAARDVETLFLLTTLMPALGRTQHDYWQTGYDALMEAFPQGALAEAQSTRLVAIAERALPDRNAFNSGILTEAELLSGYLEEPLAFRFEGSGQPSWDDRLYYQIMSSSLTRSFRRSEASFALAAVQDVVQLANEPYWQVADEVQHLRQRLRRQSSYLHPFTSNLSCTNDLIRQVTCEAQLDLLRLGLSLESYNAEHGAYPPSLDAVAPNLGGTVPLDPFTGQPYQYRVSGDTFTLYSLGGNRCDDGDRSGDDIAWRKPTASGGVLFPLNPNTNNKTADNGKALPS